eukprot:CAMPEP_0182433114 /NCGR_PEP_ID=MMETSP1167-20130531/60976_1 /TAXON_ID=2988 /ORGANISM="Mallomonas Sp, Strain CCMP3275" /LENGTH=30 /DNA_ID= /DNA_START= /DNA_END= /DNA_ORIENTATION=
MTDMNDEWLKKTIMQYKSVKQVILQVTAAD